MSRAFPNSNADYLSNAVAPVNGFPCSISAWIFPTAIPASNPAIAGAFELVGNNNIRLTLLSTNGALEAEVNSQHPATATLIPPLNQWSHCVGTFSSLSSWSAYVNGGNVGTNSTAAFPDPTGTLTGTAIGVVINSGHSNPFEGRIGEVGFWNIVLSPAQIALLASGVPACFVAPANLTGYWPVYGYNSPELDFSGNGNNMTITGALASAAVPPAVTPPKIVFYTTSGNITLPGDFNTAFNVVDCIGESGNAAGGTTLATGGGAGAGANATIVNYSAKGAGATVAVTVGVGGTGTKTIFDTANNSCVADVGTSASGATAGSGGLTTNSVGVTTYAGGNGGTGATLAGGSGGGSAGPGGAGGNAAASSTTTSGNGGTANGGAQAGGVGVGTTNPGNPGIAQSPAIWTQTSNSATASPSSGASGAGGASLTAEAGGSAVAYGGAPGGGDLVSVGTSNPGAPSAGVIVLSYLALSGKIIPFQYSMKAA